MSVQRTYLVLEAFPVYFRSNLNVIPSDSLHGLLRGESIGFIRSGESSSPIESLRCGIFGGQGREVTGHAHITSRRNIFKV